MKQIAAITRRLAAVAFADVADWSSHVEKSDIDALRAWKALRAEIIEPKLVEHGGRVLELAGDAVLVEFRSAVAAVEWAVDTQRAVANLELDASDDVRLSLRIGINVEDVIVDEDKLIGDGVNVAARIHQLASPGEIVVTGAVRDYVWNKLSVTFNDMGEHKLKHISRPVHAYRVRTETPGSRIPVRSQPNLSWTKRPAVAVLPFRNLGSDPEEGYFGEGITEDIINGLARSHSLYVIARTSTLRYRDQHMDAREIAAELGVRYIVQGSIRRRAARLRISSELVDAIANRTVWSDRFDGQDNEIFEFQDRIAARIVGTLEPRVYEAETARVLDKPTDSLDAYDCVLRALSHFYTFSDEDVAEAGRYLQRAVALDPFYAQAHAYLAWWHNLHTGRLNSPATEDAEKASRFAATAMELDPNDAFCIAVAAHIEGFLRKNLEAAADLFDRAISLNENSAFAWGVSAATYCFLGRPDEALERLRNAWRLSPFDPMNFFFCTVAGLAEIISARYDQAVGWLRKSERLNPRFAAGLRTLVAALALSGDVDAARVAASNFLTVAPAFRVSRFTSWYPLRREDDLRRLTSGLRLAGLPE